MIEVVIIPLMSGDHIILSGYSTSDHYLPPLYWYSARLCYDVAGDLAPRTVALCRGSASCDSRVLSLPTAAFTKRNHMEHTEHDLESFRQEWKDEVSRRNRAQRRLSAGDLARVIGATAPEAPGNGNVQPPRSRDRNVRSQVHDEYEPPTYHDVDNPEDSSKLGNQRLRSSLVTKEPKSALDHYEKAVEREAAGNLGESVSLYYKAEKVRHRTLSFLLSESTIRY